MASVHSDRKTDWTPKEVKLLKEKYPSKGSNIPVLLNKGRTKQAIACKASELGIQYLGKLTTELLDECELEIGSEKIEASPIICYILGVIVGDGCVTSRNRITLNVTDENFRDKFSRKLNEIGINTTKWVEEPSKGEIGSKGFQRRKRYHLQGISKDFCEWYRQLSVQDIVSCLFSKEKKFNFIEGAYESDGSLPYMGTYGTGKGKYYFEISTFDKTLATLYLLLLKNLDYHPTVNSFTSSPSGVKMYKIRLCRKDEVQDILKCISPVQKRKSLKKLD